MDYTQRLLRAIPGGAHTYSRGFDQFPENAPSILKRGKGAYAYDAEENEYLDYGMALRAVHIGYAEEAIDEAAIAQIRNGNNLTRPSMIELEAAELMIELIDSVDMVKFTKNGSTAVSAAVKLARAYTGRDFVARCAEHPFFSYDDWFIGSTPIVRGIPRETQEQTKSFPYNDLGALEELITRYPNQFACVVLEAATTEPPAEGYFRGIRELCNRHGILLILDEMITGFRWHMKGAQHLYSVEPDLCTFGKAMANGYSVACVGGRREVMELGSIELEGRERVFLLSTTHGAEMSGLGAFVATMKYMEEHQVVDHLWSYGAQLIDLLNKRAEEFNVSHSFRAGGIPCSPFYLTLDAHGNNSLELRTLFSQEMIRGGVLIPWIALSFRHGEQELEKTDVALCSALRTYADALENGTRNLLKSAPIQPVFRRFN
ncbi:MAG: glutamate-1-semialdehyde 2,1-aminomutase [Leptospiraceae bacterium]